MNKNNIPVVMEGPGTIMRTADDFGGMTVAFNSIPGGTDFAPLLNGLENDSCSCPHWGYVISGTMVVEYDDGTDETLTAGDLYYLPGGHTAMVKQDLQLIEFSPTEEFRRVMNHVGERMAEMGA